MEKVKTALMVSKDCRDLNEYKWILEHTALDLNDLKQMNINAVRGLFNVSEEEKEQLIKEIEK